MTVSWLANIVHQSTLLNQLTTHEIDLFQT